MPDNMKRSLVACRLLPILAVAIFLAPLRMAAEDWPQFRGPNGSGISETGRFPVEFGPGKNEQWMTPLPSGHSSPCIWGDRIFLTGYDGENLLTLALDRVSGRVLWQRAVAPTAIEQGSRNGNPASSTPAAGGERVHVYFGSFGLVTYDFDGNELWRKPLPVPVTQHGAATSPIVVNGLVIVANDQDVNAHLLAVDAVSGETRWKTSRAGYRRGFSTPLVWPEANPAEVILPGTLRLNGYAIDDGRELWVARGLPNEMVSSPVLANGRIYVAGWTAGAGVPSLATFDQLLGQGDADQDGRISRDEAPAGPAKMHFPYIDADKDGAIDREEWETLVDIFESSRNNLLVVRPGGRGDVTGTHVDWTFDKGLPYVPSPLVYQGRVYLVKNGGIATCLDADTGAVRFEEERLGAIGDYYSSPVGAGGLVMMISQPGTAVVIKAADELKVVARNKLAGKVMATPAIIGDTVYIRTENGLGAYSDGVR